MSAEHPAVRVSVGSAASEPHADASQPRDPAESQRCTTPLIDIHEGAEGLILEADLPGASADSLSIQLEDNVLTLHAQIDSPAPEGARLLHEEYWVGDFYRSFILSDEVDRDRITAELNQGVLRLTLPKAERKSSRRIEIKS